MKTLTKALIFAILFVQCTLAQEQYTSLYIAALAPGEMIRADTPENFAVRSVTVQSKFVYVNNIRIIVNESDQINVKSLYTYFNLSVAPNLNVTVPVGFNVTKPFGKVFKYVTVDVQTKLLDVADAEFEVPISWLTQNGLGSENLSFMRYAFGWQRVPVQLVTTTTTAYRFRVSVIESPYYAIVGQSSQDLIDEGAAQFTLSDVKVDPINPLVSIYSDYPMETQYVIIGVALLITVLLIRLYYRRHKEKKFVEKYTDPDKAPKPNYG